jgi:hypothetical protein
VFEFNLGVKNALIVINYQDPSQKSSKKYR